MRIAVIVLLVTLLCLPALASRTISVFIDETPLQLTNPPLIRDGRTLVPLRAFFEALGAEVEWDAGTQTAIVERGDVTVRVPLRSSTAFVNERRVAVQVPAQIIDGCTYIPLRFVGEALGDDVLWNSQTLTISITRAVTQGQAAPRPAEDPPSSRGGSQQAQADMDQVVVWVELDITYHAENQYQAGDPATTARYSTDISFRRSGAYRFVRLPRGRQVMAIPGTEANPIFPAVTHVSVSQTHTCQNDESQPFGRQTVDLSSSAKIHPALGGFRFMPAEGSRDRWRIILQSSQVETPFSDCRVDRCMNGFGFQGDVGENPEACVEDENGALDCFGFDVAVVSWDSLKALTGGGEIPLAIPLSADHKKVEDYEDPPGYPARFTETYRVRGSISSIDQLPLSPIPTN